MIPAGKVWVQRMMRKKDRTEIQCGGNSSNLNVQRSTVIRHELTRSRHDSTISTLVRENSSLGDTRDTSYYNLNPGMDDRANPRRLMMMHRKKTSANEPHHLFSIRERNGTMMDLDERYYLHERIGRQLGLMCVYPLIRL